MLLACFGSERFILKELRNALYESIIMAATNPLLRRAVGGKGQHR